MLAGRPRQRKTGDTSKRQFATGASILLAVIAAAASAANLGMANPEGIVDASGALLILIVAGFFCWLLLLADWQPEERKRLVVIFFLFLAACVFWSAFEQAGSSMNLFASATPITVWARRYPAPWYQSVQPMFIILLAPVFGALWLRLGDHDPPSPAKFSLALLLAGGGFLLLGFGAQFTIGGGRVSPLWLIATYFLHTCGELCLSPVGLSAMTKLAPARVPG